MTERKTVFSECRKYRYCLWREFEKDILQASNDDYLMVIGLNPSTADETLDDNTIRRCIGFAKAWGYGALCMTNLFAWRDTKPEAMKDAMFPVGGDNDLWLRECAAGAGMILAAWGKHGSFLDRGKTVAHDLRMAGRTVHALRLNKDHSPMHPLYVAADTVPIIFR